MNKWSEWMGGGGGEVNACRATANKRKSEEDMQSQRMWVLGLELRWSALVASCLSPAEPSRHPASFLFMGQARQWNTSPCLCLQLGDHRAIAGTLQCHTWEASVPFLLLVKKGWKQFYSKQTLFHTSNILRYRDKRWTVHELNPAWHLLCESSSIRHIGPSAFVCHSCSGHFLSWALLWFLCWSPNSKCVCIWRWDL